MSVSPGTYNFSIQRRSDYSLVLRLKGSDDAAINLTGATVAAQAWNKQRSKKYADFAVAYPNRANGEVTVSLTDAQTTELPDLIYYDVLVTGSGGLRDYYLEGEVTVSEGYTE